MKVRAKNVIVYLCTAMAVLLLCQWASRSATVLSETSPISRERCIVIDPGHGGVDGGATSCSGILESRFNLEIALRLRDVFHLLGYDTKMIRTTDISVYTDDSSIARKKITDLKERVRMVGETENPLLLSIHQNIFADSRYSGAQVFYPDTPGSRELAKSLQSAFSCLGSKRQEKRAAGVYLMEHIQCTGVLIECGFLSNPQEEANLRNPHYQQKLAAVIATTVGEYCSNT